MDSEQEVQSGEPIDSAPIAEGSGSAPQSELQSQAPAPEPREQSAPWDAFKRLPEFQGQDDRAIAGRLYQAMERERAASHALAQYQQVLPYAQEYIAHRPEFEAWRKSQQQAQQPAKPEKPAWWNPPQVKESSKRYLIKDEEGRDAIDPNAPLHAREELAEYQQYKADFARRFLENPEQTLGPMIQEMAAKQAQEIVHQQFEAVNNEQFVNSVEQENRDWLFDPQTGNVTPEGLLVHKYIEEARELGINGPKQRWDYAVAKTERDTLARLFDETQALQASRPPVTQQPTQPLVQQPPAPQAAPPAPEQQDLAQQNMQYLRREAARNPSRSAGTASNDPRTPKPRRSFADMLKEDASSRGLI